MKDNYNNPLPGFKGEIIVHSEVNLDSWRDIFMQKSFFGEVSTLTQI